MEPSGSALALARRFESLRLTAYQDVGGKWTIGYGNTQGVVEGQVWTPSQAEAGLARDMVLAGEALSRHLEEDVLVTQGMFDALSDFTFNEGEGRLAASTLLRLVNQGDKEGAAGQFGRWIYAGKVVQPGLVLRRLAEKELFES